MSKKVRHILALSGGKDSSALAIYMKDKVADIEYVFCDTEEELPETYSYLTKLEAFLGKKITILKYKDGYGFRDLLKLKGGFLPSSNSRWCTQYLKLLPYEEYIGDDEVVSYVGIRADEPNRTGYVSSKKNIITRFPFKEDNIRKEDVNRILVESGLGIPEYYKWRSRSGCYFCFYQQKREWVGLLENHPDLFEKAKEFEKLDTEDGRRFTWCQHESLDELSRPERVAQIKENYLKRQEQQKNSFKSHQKLSDIWSDSEEEDDDDSSGPCQFCHL